MSISLTVRPDRPRVEKFAHGLVAADWTTNSVTGIKISTYNFYVTDIAINAQTDLTAEIDTTESIQVQTSIQRETAASGDVQVVSFTMGIPQNTHISLNTPIMLKVDDTYHTCLRLGGATASTCDVYLIGYDF